MASEKCQNFKIIKSFRILATSLCYSELLLTTTLQPFQLSPDKENKVLYQNTLATFLLKDINIQCKNFPALKFISP